MILFADPIDTVVIHHSASTRGVTTREIKKWHVDKGWDDIGYHLVIPLSGRLEEGRPFRFVGAHCHGHNAHTLGICVVGDNTRFGQEWTIGQVDTLKTVVGFARALNPNLRILGHRDLGETKCPGTDLREVLGDLYGG